jgi:general L-amino acid transport system permease protein
MPMFSDRINAIAAILCGSALAYIGAGFVRWAVIDAVWMIPAGVGSEACRTVSGEGACWAVIHERIRFIVFGVYPFDEQWRPLIACVLFVALYGASAVRAWWTPWLIAAWIAVPTAAIVLMRGGVAGLIEVPSGAWGGLPLTFLLSTVGFALAAPLATALAFGRRSTLLVIRALSIAYIELIRGVPVVTFLFMASVMFPLFAPQGVTVDKLLRTQIALVLVIAAYLAEVLRAGLQAVPQGQYEAASSLGLSWWQTTSRIVLPQAVRAVIPAIVNTFIAFFKDTSLVAVIGLFDLLGAAKAVIVEAQWVGFGVEVYLFAAAVYFVFCFSVSSYSQRLERLLESE